MVVDLSLFYLGSDPCSVFSCLCLGDPSPGGRTMMKLGALDGGRAEDAGPRRSLSDRSRLSSSIDLPLRLYMSMLGKGVRRTLCLYAITLRGIVGGIPV